MNTRVHRLILLLTLTVLAFSISGCATGQRKSGQQTEITSYAFTDGALTLAMSTAFSESYTIYKPGDPFTVVVELPGVSMGKTEPRVTSNKGGITEVRFSEATTPNQVTRLEVSLDSPSDLIAERTGNNLRLRVASSAPAAAPVKAAVEPEAEKPAPANPATEVTNIRFEPAAANTLNLIVSGDGVLSPDVYAMGDKIIMDFPGIKMSAIAPMKVVAPVTGIRKSRYEGSPRLILDVEKNQRFDVTSVGNSVVMAFHGVVSSKADRKEVAEAKTVNGQTMVQNGGSPEGEPRLPRARYGGKIISLDFQNADIVPIFRFIGEVAELNVVIHPDVKGSVTLKLLNVPWDQALDIVLKLSNLDKSIEGNIMTIAPMAVFAAQKEEAKKLREANVKAADIVQGTVHLDYIEAAEFSAKLKEASVLSERGKTRVDQRTNTIIVNDTQDVINRIVNEERQYWDTPEHGKLQIMIEARIIEVDTGFSRTLGISWGGSATNNNFSFIDDKSTYDFSVNTPVSAAGPDVSIGSGGGVISIGYLESFTANMSISALESVNESRSLANPKVLTMDGQPAKIEQGTQIPYSTTSSSGTQTMFASATLSLEVTPEIQPNSIIKMKIKAKNDSPTTVQGADAPGINTQSVDTSALIRDGETLVLGGIYKQKDDDTEAGVPWLRSIPGLGWLFKSKSIGKTQTELLIFIMPKIVSRSMK